MPSSRVVVERDVPFRELDDRTLRLDTYRPAETASNPAVVYVHGGAWRAGSKGQFSRYAVEFADRGYVGVDPNYRLAPDANVPEMVADVLAGVRWCHEHADSLGVDPDRIAIAGHSAGAHLAALAALAPGEFDPEDTTDSPSLATLAGFSGVYDLREDRYAPLVGNGPDAAERASPITWVDADAPPTFLAHAADDETVPIDETDALYEELLSAGVSIDRFRADGGGHVFLYDDMGWYEKATERFASFLNRHLWSGTHR
ncbi:alpha/beta hydrolase [Halapricum hydrolyticum]|uniref:Alpha/beta hydrolase n=1 Tax=Halapricum hydrolyticum TaxID=2979991 RepID=A0AAE3I8I5_9EURY|nr:alpha/beta hydrolase [Halapricum hydrolyticum]MCU4716772.1 alpha/beta hydrolase [Halapricum hydrolyticum]MCU4725623.1 alpha/beta hydrolase [Halapricum hydrolyticum]